MSTQRSLLKRPMFMLLIVAAVIGASLLIFKNIYALELPKFVEEMNNATLGALVTSIITVLLLQHQSLSDERREQNVKVYEMKSKSFQDFIHVLLDKWDDQKIDEKEIEEIRKSFYKDVYSFIGYETLKQISNLFVSLSSDIGDPSRTRRHIFQIINALKTELGLFVVDAEEGPECLAKIDGALTKIQYSSEESIAASGERVHWHFVMFDDAMQRKWLAEHSVLVIADSREEGGVRTSLLCKVEKGDVLFVYSRGYGYVGVFEALERGKSIVDVSSRLLENDADAQEGQLKVKQIVFLNNEAHVGRDAPRLRAIQRIASLDSVRELLTRFIAKSGGESTPEGKILLGLKTKGGQNDIAKV